MADKHLYLDEKLKIDTSPSSTEDHILYIREGSGGEWAEYLIPREILRELAGTPRGGIERKIYNFNFKIMSAIQTEEIGVDGLHVAFCQAYAEQKRLIQHYIDEKRLV